MIQADIIVIGSGMAGASVAAHLAEAHDVVLLEREDRPGYHSTGRSAAVFSETYGNRVVRALARASRGFLTDPPPGFASHPLVHPRGSLFIASEPQLGALREFAALPDVEPATRWVSTEEACAICPILRSGYVAGALLEPDSTDIEVNALHQGYLRLFRSRDGRSLHNAAVSALRHEGRGWVARAGEDEVAAPLVVNAAGAWADEIAVLAGIPPIGLQPYRRTIVIVDAPRLSAVNSWPMVNDIDEQFYFKPDAGRLLLSPADETPVAASDAQPDEWDVAVAVDRLQTATDLTISRVRHRWAGLRTFAADRSPVVGFSDAAPGFFWLAGQGGYGIQTAPALSRAAAALVCGAPLPDDLRELGVREAELSPARFAAAR